MRVPLAQPLPCGASDGVKTAGTFGWQSAWERKFAPKPYLAECCRSKCQWQQLRTSHIGGEIRLQFLYLTERPMDSAKVLPICPV